LGRQSHWQGCRATDSWVLPVVVHKSHMRTGDAARAITPSLNGCSLRKGEPRSGVARARSATSDDGARTGPLKYLDGMFRGKVDA